MIKISDFIFKYLADYGVKHCFVITGGGAMHLNDSLKKESRITPICNYHEQASAIAAEGYARITNKLSVVNVTTGPGGLNTLTGVMGQWTDSIPVLYISGQVKYKTTIKSQIPFERLRQLGDQEVDIIKVVEPITKYSKMVVDAKQIKYELQKAIYRATSGRKGPVWLDIPIDIQSTLIDEESLICFENDWDERFIHKKSQKVSDTDLKKASILIQNSKRPLIIAGHGIRLGDAQKDFLKLLETVNIPVVTTFNGVDLLPWDHKNYIGRIGTIGTRAGNFALQNSDLIICLGTRNNIRQISYNGENFANKAKKIIVDIDCYELTKNTIQGDIQLNYDAKKFVSFLQNEKKLKLLDIFDWIDWCRERKNKYKPISIEQMRYNKKINPYYFMAALTSASTSNHNIVASNGTACVSLFQAGQVKKNQRIFWNSGCASMGYGLPAAIGACLANKKETICIEGDGSLQMNLQELQTVKHYNLPIKLFVLNNNGYYSIAQTQANYFQSNLIGCTKETGVSFPDNEKLAALYDFKYFIIDSHENIYNQIEKILKEKGRVLCEVILQKNYIFKPKLSSKKMDDGTMVSQPLENMFPFLSKEELESNIIKE